MTKHQDPAAIAAQPGTEIAMLPPAERALVVLKSTETEKQLRELVARTSPISAPVDAAGREEVHRAAMDHKNARVAIEKTGKAAREDATAYSKAVIKEEQRLVAIIAEEETRLFDLRDTYDAKVRQEKEEAERKERERVAAIREKIEQIAALHLQSGDDSAAELAATIADLQAFEVTFEDFAEFQDEAKAVVSTALAALMGLHARAEAREAAAAAQREAEAKLAAERAEFERQKAELQRQLDELAAAKAAAAPAVVAGPNEPAPEVVGTVKPAYDPLDPGNWRDGNPPPELPNGQRYSETTFRDDGEPILLNADGTRSVFCDVDEEPTSLAALDQPRQQALNEQTRATAEALADEPMSEDERARHIAGHAETVRFDLSFDVAAGPDVTVEMVSIPRDEYERLLTRSRWLECLEAAGVDNWDGIDEALRINRERVPA